MPSFSAWLPVIVVASLFPKPSYQNACNLAGSTVIYVSPSGNDTHSCLNSTTPEDNPCRTVNYALLGEKHSDGLVTLDLQQCPTNETVAPKRFNICIRLTDGVHRLEGEAQATNIFNLTIEAVNPLQAAIRCRQFPNSKPKMWDNLVFYCSRNILLSGVIVEQCGSTSSGIFVHLSDEILIYNTVFRNITGIGAKFHESYSITLRNCTFEDNNNYLSEDVETFDQDCINVEALDYVSLSGGAMSIVARLTLDPVSVLVEECRFIHNSVVFNDKNDNLPAHLHADGHGGGAYVRLTRVTNSLFVFRDSVFESNVATIDGGGLYFSFSNDSNNNTVLIDNCEFVNNIVFDRSGGAIAIAFNDKLINNEVIIRNCNFTGNVALGGGAVAVTLYDVGATPHRILIENSSFSCNLANQEGSAVGLFSFLRFDAKLFQIEIKNSVFRDNDVDNPLVVNEGIARAAVYSFRFPLLLSGNNLFYNNRGGGISIVDSMIIVDPNSHVAFKDNTANFGGGLQLVGSCLLVVHPNTRVDFINNTARFLGGGLMVNTPIVEHARNFLNRFCFIRFSIADTPAQQWENVSINFINNTAHVGGAALYSSDLRRCSWLNLSLADSVDYTIFTPPDNVSVPFHFEGNILERSGPNQIVQNHYLATSPVTISLKTQNILSHLQPGESFSVDLYNRDKFGNSRRGILCVEFQGLTSSNECARYAIGDVEERIFLTVPEINGSTNPLQPFGAQPSSNTTVSVDLRLPLYSGTPSTFTFTLQVCHPGYILSEGLCVCNVNDTSVIRCDTANRYVYVWEGSYAYRSSNGSLALLSGVPAALLQCRRMGELPGCLFTFDDQDAQCADGRKGFFCGQCSKGGVTLDLKSCDTDCTLGIVIFIAWCLGIVLVSVIVLGFNVELPAELRAAIFYVQVIGLLFRPYSIMLSDSLKKFGFFLDILTFGLPLPVCLSENMPNFAVAALGFVTPLLALTVVCLYAICARFNTTISSRGAIHGLSLLGLFIYKYLADTTFIFLSCRATEDGYVFVYDGTQSCLSAEYLTFFILAVLLTVTIILPAPVILCILTAKRWSKFDLYHFTDQITKDVRPERGWYAGWDIGRRLIFIAVSFFGVYFDTSLSLLANFILAACVLLVHLATKPFKVERNNWIEGLVLLNLLVVTIAYIEPPQVTFYTFLVFLVTLLPYLYIVGYFVYIAATRIRKRNKLKSLQKDLANTQSCPSTSALQDSLVVAESKYTGSFESMTLSSNSSSFTPVASKVSLNSKKKERRNCDSETSGSGGSGNNKTATLPSGLASITQTSNLVDQNKCERDINLFELSDN